MQNNFNKDYHDYPEDTTEAYKILINYKTTHYKPATIMVDDPEEVLFANVGGSNGKYISYKSGVCGSDRGERKVQ